MQFPRKDVSNGTLIVLGRYTGALVQADPETTALAAHIREPQEELVGSITRRNQAIDHLIDVEAQRDYQLHKMNEAIIAFGRAALASFQTRDNPDFLRLFPISPSDTTKTSHRDRPRVYGALVEAATAPATPVALKPMVKALSTQWAALVAAEHTVDEANKQVAAAAKAEQAAREAWDVGYRVLHAQLTSLFPRNKTRVESYFRKVKADKKKAPEPPVIYEPEPIPPEAVAALGEMPKKA